MGPLRSDRTSIYMELTAWGCRAARTVHEPVPMQILVSLVSERPMPYHNRLAQSRWGCLLPALARPTQSSEPIFSWSYGSGLPTSLTYIVLLTRGCSPWRPAIVMGTTWGESLHSSPGFSRAGQCNTGRCSRRGALRGRGAYLWSCRFQANPPLTKKRQLFPGLRPAFPGSIASQFWPSRGGELCLQVREYWPDSLSTRGCTPARGRPAPPLRAELP